MLRAVWHGLRFQNLPLVSTKFSLKLTADCLMASAACQNSLQVSYFFTQEKLEVFPRVRVLRGNLKCFSVRTFSSLPQGLLWTLQKGLQARHKNPLKLAVENHLESAKIIPGVVKKVKRFPCVTITEPHKKINLKSQKIFKKIVERKIIAFLFTPWKTLRGPRSLSRLCNSLILLMTISL